MERIAIDVLGPLPETDNGNKYLLIAMDYFTKWPEAYPLPNQEATTVVLVGEFFIRMGIPLEIHSDQGRNFESNVFQEICKLLHIKKTRTTPLHPQSDGMVERLNRTIEAQLAIFVSENQRDWDIYVPLLLMAYRSAVHETTKCTPAELMFRRNLRLPTDLLYGQPEEEKHVAATEYVSQLCARLDKVHQHAREKIQIATERMKHYYDTKTNAQPLEPGQKVWLHNPKRRKGVSPKLSRPWEGPYLVKDRLNDVVYRIQKGPHSKPKIVHRNRLWRYSGERHSASPESRSETNLSLEQHTQNNKQQESSQDPHQQGKKRPPAHYAPTFETNGT